jgi:hypothetical protein
MGKFNWTTLARSADDGPVDGIGCRRPVAMVHLGRVVRGSKRYPPFLSTPRMMM